MYKDEIIAEVWRNRDAYTAEHQHDLSKIVTDLQSRQRESQAVFVDRREPPGTLQVSKPTDR